MHLIRIYEDHNTDLFPFYFWADSWGRFTQPILGRNMPVIFMVMRGGSVKYYGGREELASMQRGLLEKFLSGLEGELERKNEALYSGLEQFSNRMGKADIRSLSNAELSAEYARFHEIMYQINAYGMVYAFLEYPESEFTQGLEQYLERQARITGAKTQPSEAFAILTSPTKGTALRELQERILQIALEVQSDAGLRKTFEANGAEEIGKMLLQPALERMRGEIASVTQDFCWINYGYVGPAMPQSYFISEVKEALGGDAGKKLSELRDADAKVARRQGELLAEFGVDARHRRRFELCSSLVHFKNRRKEKIYYALHSIEGLQAEIARRLSLTPVQARYFLPNEIYGGLAQRQKLHPLAAEQRRHYCAYLIEGGNVSLLNESESQKWLALVQEEAGPGEVRELKGNCACPGVARGTARVVLDANDLHRVGKGDILVSWSTNPNMVPGMRRAAAIVTEMGE